MRQANNYLSDVLDLTDPEASGDLLWRAAFPAEVREEQNDVLITIPFYAQKRKVGIERDPEREPVLRTLRVRGYGGAILRLTLELDGSLTDEESPILELHPSLKEDSLRAERTDDGWQVLDREGRRRLQLRTTLPPARPWCKLLSPPDEALDLTLWPDGQTEVPLTSYDQFFPKQIDSAGLAYVTRAGAPQRTAFSFCARPQECFAGTGERFAKLDLSGRTLVLDNADGLGVNSRRAYKNVPFYLSSRPYGLFAHTSAEVRLSLADVSTRAAQGVILDPRLDLFVIGGGSLERILFNYRRLTGFPPEVPRWSYGTWMSRMSYTSAEEMRGIAHRLREGGFPCDVMHNDTGWFVTDWVCEWEFSPERFPDPAGFMAEMRRLGFRISLWNTPNFDKQNKLLPMALKEGYVVPRKEVGEAKLSDISFVESAGIIDFSNPRAVRWYQSLLGRLFEAGASAIKTDFGEEIPMGGQYHGMSAEQLHNLYALLYQRAAWEAAARATGEPVLWARAGWAGCQRYPVHWGGDAACTWDGLAGSIRGGLHLGLSGFAFWSHDVPGFHGIPDFMANWPAEDLYLRWTQVGAFTSHMRYHGTTPREPYQYPGVADAVRKWLKLRYALIPYIMDQARQSVRSGYPLLRALVLHHEDDPVCWHIDDQYYFGAEILVAPILSPEGVRNVYLPEGRWIDFWTGERLAGRQWLMGLKMPLERMPLYVKEGSALQIYPRPVQSTDEMDMAQVQNLPCDESYQGFAGSILGELTGLA